MLAQAVLVVPKTLAQNSGFDQLDAVLALTQTANSGFHIHTGQPMDPASEGVWDLYRCKRQCLHSATVLAQQLLLIDEMLKATGPSH